MDNEDSIKVTIKTLVGTEYIPTILDERHIILCKVVEGRVERYGHTEIELRKDIFDDNIEGVWDTSNPKPSLTLGKTLVSVNGFDKVDDYNLTNVRHDDKKVIIRAHHPGHKINNVDLGDLLRDNFEFIESTSAKYRYTWTDGTSKTYTTEEPQVVWSKFNSKLDNRIITLPNDSFRALAEKGGSGVYMSGWGGFLSAELINVPSSSSSVYTTTTARGLMRDISRYASGIGYHGLISNDFKDIDTDKESDTEHIISTNKYIYTYSKDSYDILLHLSTNQYKDTQGNTQTSVDIEWIEGDTDDVVRFILDLTVGDDSYPHFISPPTQLIEDHIPVKTTYTEEEIIELSSGSPIPMSDVSIGESHITNKYTSRIRIRPRGLCTDILEIIGIYTNRSFFFTNDGFYLMSDRGISNENVISLNKTNKNQYGNIEYDIIHYNLLDKIIISSDLRGLDEEDHEYVDRIAQRSEVEPYTSDNIMISQGVQSENYQFTTRNVDYIASGRERDLEFHIVDMDRGNYRNRTVALCALHGLLSKSRYGNNISYTLFERNTFIPTVLPRHGTSFTSLEELTSVEHPLTGSTAVVDTGFDVTYYNYINGSWQPFTPTIPERDKYDPIDIAYVFIDQYSGISMIRAPLGYIIREYPTGLTKVSWGNNPSTSLASKTRTLMTGYTMTQPIGSGDTQISNKTSSRIVVGNMSANDLAQTGVRNSLYTGLIMEKDAESNTYQLVGYDKGVEQAKFNTEGKIEAGAGAVILDENGFSMEGDGVYLTGEGLRFEDDIHGLIKLDHLGMYIYGIKEDDDTRTLRLIIDGNGVRDGVNRFLINENGLTVTEQYSDEPFLKVNEDGFSLTAEQDNLKTLFEVKGNINLSNNQVEGGGVTLSKEGLVMTDSHGSIVLANTSDVQGLIASKGEDVHLALTGEGLSLPGYGTDEKPESMKLDRGGITFKKGKDETIDTSLIKMTAGELTFSKYMKLAGVSKYYEQVKLNGEGLSVHGGAVKLNMGGLTFNQGGVILNDAGFAARGIRIDDNGLVLHKPSDDGNIRVAQMTSEGLSFVSEEESGSDVIYNPLITLGSRGLVTDILTIDRDGLTTLQGGVNISPDGIDTMEEGSGVKLNRGGLSLYTDGRATERSALKFRMEIDDENEVTMGTVSSERDTIPVPDATSTVNGGTSSKNTYATTIDGQSSDGGDSTLILKSTQGGLVGDTVIKSPQMSNKGVSMYMEYDNTVILGNNSNGLSTIRNLGDTLMGFNSSKFPLGICDPAGDTKLKVTTVIDQPCGPTNWEFIRYYGININIGGISWRKSLDSITPTGNTRTVTLYSDNLRGVRLGASVSVTLDYGSTMDMFWFLFEHCRPSIKVTKVEIVGGGITTTQDAILPYPFNNVSFTYAYWCGSFVELSHTYMNTVRNRTSKSIYFEVYRDKVSTGVSRTISSQGTVSIDPVSYTGISRTGMYNAQYRMQVGRTHNPDSLLVEMDADYISPSAGGGHIYLRPDGSYLRGNTELRGGDKARLSIRSGEEGWGDQGIDFHNSKVNFNTAKLDGSPDLSESFMSSIRSRLVLSAQYRRGLSRTANTWYRPAVSSRVNIVMITQNHQSMTVHLWPTGEPMPDNGIKIFKSHDTKHGDGEMTATIVVPIGYSYMIKQSNGPIAYEFPLYI